MWQQLYTHLSYRLKRNLDFSEEAETRDLCDFGVGLMLTAWDCNDSHTHTIFSSYTFSQQTYKSSIIMSETCRIIPIAEINVREYWNVVVSYHHERQQIVHHLLWNASRKGYHVPYIPIGVWALLYDPLLPFHFRLLTRI